MSALRLVYIGLAAAGAVLPMSCFLACGLPLYRFLHTRRAA